MPSPKPPIQDLPDDLPDEADPDEPDSSDPSGAIQVQVVNHTDNVNTQLDDWLATQARRAVDLCGVAQAQLTVAIVADDEMAQLHEQYTGVAGTTDVLTFDLLADAAWAEGDSPPGPAHAPSTLEGDIVVCIDQAKRQAQARGHETRHELLLYAIHGLLHLLGEDDHNQADYQRMHAREDELLQALGIGQVFNTKANPNP